jgi:hypothetical protein
MVQIEDCSCGLVFSKKPLRWKRNPDAVYSWKHIVPRAFLYKVRRTPDDEIHKLLTRVLERQRALIKHNISILNFAICFDNAKEIKKIYRWLTAENINIQFLQKYKIYVFLIQPDNVDKKLFDDMYWGFSDSVWN